VKSHQNPQISPGKTVKRGFEKPWPGGFLFQSHPLRGMTSLWDRMPHSSYTAAAEDIVRSEGQWKPGSRAEPIMGSSKPMVIMACLADFVDADGLVEGKLAENHGFFCRFKVV